MTVASLKPNKSSFNDDFYPTSDGKPMAETQLHQRQMMYCLDALETYYADRRDVYVWGNNFLYWEEGNPRAVVSPDCYVVFGAENHQRDTFKVWEEEDRTPDVVIEITSRKTKRQDTDRKRPLYEQTLRVSEYFLFDPTGDYLSPRLQGYRLEAGRYVRLELVNNRLASEQLGLELVVDGERMRLYNPAAGAYLLSYEEQAERAEIEASRAQFETKRAEREANRAEQAMIRAGREANRAEQAMQKFEQETQRADIEAQRADTEAQRADIEAQRANYEAQRAGAEAQARKEAEAEMARLQAELETLRRQADKQT